MIQQAGHLFVEVDEPLRAVDVVEGGEARHRAVDVHRMGSNLASARQQQPVWVRAGDKDALVPGHVAEVAEGVAREAGLIATFGPKKGHRM